MSKQLAWTNKILDHCSLRHRGRFHSSSLLDFMSRTLDSSACLDTNDSSSCVGMWAASCARWTPVTACVFSKTTSRNTEAGPELATGGQRGARYFLLPPPQRSPHLPPLPPLIRATHASPSPPLLVLLHITLPSRGSPEKRRGPHLPVVLPPRTAIQEGKCLPTGGATDHGVQGGGRLWLPF
jgi:hypothetical protein